MEFVNVCTRCRYATDDDDAMEAHHLIHKARIIKFEPLKTHIAQALTESRSQEDTANWEQALTLVNKLIDACSDCGMLECKCEAAQKAIASLNGKGGDDGE